MRQENYAVKTCEIELCPNQKNPFTTRSNYSHSPPRFGWQSPCTSSSEDISDQEIDLSDNSFTDDESYTSLPSDASQDNVEPQVPEEADAVDPQFRSPAAGDRIQVFSLDLNNWRDATVIKTDKRMLTKFPHFYNVQYGDNGEKGSVKLDSESLWRFVDPDRQDYFWWKWGHLYDAETNQQEGGEQRVGVHQ